MREITADQFHDRHEDIYRVMMNEPVSMKMGIITFHQLPAALTHDFPEVDLATHLYYSKRTLLYTGNTAGSTYFEERELFHADENFLKFFSFQLLSGDPLLALKEPRSLVLTEKTAVRYFGSRDVIGKILYIKKEPYTITGVLKETTHNTHLRFNVLISKTSLKPSNFALDYSGLTYIRLAAHSDAQALVAKLDKNQLKYLPFEPEQELYQPFTLQPLSEIYFFKQSPAFLNSILKSGSKESTNMLMLVAVVIIILSMFNYLNFAQSKALFTFKQIAVRRVFGASKRSFIVTVMFEALVVVGISLVIGILVVALTIPLFNRLFNTDIQFLFMANAQVVVTIGILVVLVTVALGFMSYYVLSRTQNTNIQAMEMQRSSKGSRIVNGIFIVQLTGSTILIAIALAVLHQVNFLKNHSPGFEPKGVVEINLSSVPPSVSLSALKDQINQIPGVVSSSLTYGGPLTGRWTTSVTINDQPYEIGSYNGDIDYVNTFKIQLIEGRVFDPEIASDTSAMLINEAGKKLLQLDENLETNGKSIQLSSKIIGVVKDFHYASLREGIEPAVIGFGHFERLDDFGEAKIAVRSDKLDNQQLATFKQILAHVSPDVPFEYVLLEDNYENLHQKETAQLNMILAGGLISLIISIFGLIGLTMFLSVRKIKEVAIRKTLGASTGSIIFMFIKKLVVLVLVSFILSIPFSWVFISKWLSGFVYKVMVSPTVWILTLVFMVLITLVSVFQLLYQAAKKNPAVVLKRD